MSTGAKLSVLVVILLAVMAGLNSYKAPVATPVKTQDQGQAQTGATPGTRETVAPPAPDISDAGIEKDVASLDQSLKAETEASASADQGLSDKPVAQGE